MSRHADGTHANIQGKRIRKTLMRIAGIPVPWIGGWGWWGGWRNRIWCWQPHLMWESRFATLEAEEGTKPQDKGDTTLFLQQPLS